MRKIAFSNIDETFDCIEKSNESKAEFKDDCKKKTHCMMHKIYNT